MLIKLGKGITRDVETSRLVANDDAATLDAIIARSPRLVALVDYGWKQWLDDSHANVKMKSYAATPDGRAQCKADSEKKVDARLAAIYSGTVQKKGGGVRKAGMSPVMREAIELAKIWFNARLKAAKADMEALVKATMAEKSIDSKTAVALIIANHAMTEKVQKAAVAMAAAKAAIIDDDESEDDESDDVATLMLPPPDESDDVADAAE